ncbi:MAG: GFA family protein [Alphaproteobacteria bacterium]|nr:GFA family protein [Alphaproteobacteria bacterium]
MKIDGGCHCGNITYEAEVDPEKAAICHCTDCQSMSGSAFRTVVLSFEDAFTLLSGEPKMYIKTGGSGAKRIQAFCPDCGSQIYATAIGDGPKIYGLRLGTVRQRDELPPKRQIWHRSAQKWLPNLGSIPTVD